MKVKENMWDLINYFVILLIVAFNKEIKYFISLKELLGKLLSVALILFVVNIFYRIVILLKNKD